MRRICSFIGAAVVATLATGAAQAGVLVLGSSLGYHCYSQAKQESASAAALKSCDEALDAGTMSARDIVATHVNRGIIRLNREDHSGAIADFDQAIRLDPQEPESYLNKGSALLRMGRTSDEAIGLFDTALERQTRRPELAYFGRAIAHEVRGDIQSAYLDYRRASRAAPKWQDPREEMSRFTVRRRGS